MTILNNMGRYIRLMFGSSRNTSAQSTPGSSNTLRFNDFYSQTAGYRIRPETSLSTAATQVASDTEVNPRPLGFPNNVSSYPSSTEDGFFRRVYALRENFSIVDNEYILGETSGAGQIPTGFQMTISATMDANSLKTVYGFTYSNTTEENVNIYGFYLVGMISGFVHNTSDWNVSTAVNNYIPIAAIKFDQPKVVEPGGVLQISYTLDFSNLISEANEIVVTQQ